MTKIGVTVPTGEKAEVEIVRFFENYGKKYLVYTLNEKDEQGFVKLYVARIDEATDSAATQKALVGSFIDDDNEWKAVKDEFKKIISENSDGGVTSINDLNPADLANVNVKGNRVIKLMESYVNLLGANQKHFDAPAAPINAVPDTGYGYQAPETNNTPVFEMPTSATPEMPQTSVFPKMPTYQDHIQPVTPMSAPIPTAPATPAAPVEPVGYSAPGIGAYQEPITPFPAMPNYNTPTVPVEPTPMATAGVNYEEMYNELKEKYDRCNAELEKVTNENIELRIKIDDIREILNEN